MLRLKHYIHYSYMTKQKGMTYKESGVNYSLMDPLKIMAQKEGLKTSKNVRFSHMKEISASRGESAYVVEYHDCYFAIVEECLGTKSMVADGMRKTTGKTYYNLIAQDSVAYIVNDLITVGAQPTTVVAYWAMGDSKWCEDKKRMADLVKGWAQACDMAGASWGGGETPTLKGIISPNTVDLAGACFGIIKPKKRLILGEKLGDGDAIILLESRGIQSNGVSLARKIAEKLPKGYATKMSNGAYYGEALLVPTIIYAKIVRDLFENNIDIHYMSNITGHGWRKIMRSSKQLTYRLTNLPPVPEVFNFLIKHGPVEKKEAYGDFNMGAGFAIFVPQNQAEKVVSIAKKQKLKAYIAGIVEKGEKQVIIEPLSITYSNSTLKVRA